MVKSVCLVGNGPSVLNRPLGHIIDSHDIVVRFNQYVITEDLAQFTGTKTDVWAVNEGLTDGQQPPPKPRPPRTLLCVPFWKSTEGCIWTRMADIVPDGVELIDERVARLLTFADERLVWASTGLLAISHFALDHNVSIVGFDHFHPSKPHHYADDYVPFCGHHSGFTESQVVRTLEIRGMLRRLKPSAAG